MGPEKTKTLKREIITRKKLYRTTLYREFTVVSNYQWIKSISWEWHVFKNNTEFGIHIFQLKIREKKNIQGLWVYLGLITCGLTGVLAIDQMFLQLRHTIDNIDKFSRVRFTPQISDKLMDKYGTFILISCSSTFWLDKV